MKIVLDDEIKIIDAISWVIVAIALGEALGLLPLTIPSA